jgi:hypothetical protein
MRGKNWRLIVVGAVLLAAAAGFFLYMLSIQHRSNDPAAMMQTVGMVSGGIAGLALIMLVLGLLGIRK